MASMAEILACLVVEGEGRVLLFMEWARRLVFIASDLLNPLEVLSIEVLIMTFEICVDLIFHASAAFISLSNNRLRRSENGNAVTMSAAGARTSRALIFFTHLIKPFMR